MTNKLKIALLTGAFFLVLILAQSVIAAPSAYCVEQNIGKGIMAETYKWGPTGYFKYNHTDSACLGNVIYDDIGIYELGLDGKPKYNTSYYTNEINQALCLSTPNVAGFNLISLTGNSLCKQRRVLSNLTTSGFVPAYVVKINCTDDGKVVTVRDDEMDLISQRQKSSTCITQSPDPYENQTYYASRCNPDGTISTTNVDCKLLKTNKCINTEYLGGGKCVKTCVNNSDCAQIGSAYTCDLLSPLVANNRTWGNLNATEGICVNNLTTI